jgi:hypothetical protein
VTGDGPSAVPWTLPSDVPCTLLRDVTGDGPSAVPWTLPNDVPCTLLRDVTGAMPIYIYIYVPWAIPNDIPCHLLSDTPRGDVRLQAAVAGAAAEALRLVAAAEAQAKAEAEAREAEGIAERQAQEERLTNVLQELHNHQEDELRRMQEDFQGQVSTRMDPSSSSQSAFCP